MTSGLQDGMHCVSLCFLFFFSYVNCVSFCCSGKVESVNITNLLCDNFLLCEEPGLTKRFIFQVSKSMGNCSNWACGILSAQFLNALTPLLSITTI